MSAPPPAAGDDRPRAGYYPDPSIPGYVRYWNGSSWVPGTSRPAPQDGEPLAPPPGAAPEWPSVEETGPHFFDEDPADTPSAASPSPSPDSSAGAPAAPSPSAPSPAPASLASLPPSLAPKSPSSAAPAQSSAPSTPSPSPSPADSPAESQHGSRPEPASAWGADRSRQSGFGGDRDRKVSWGTDPRVPHPLEPSAPATGAADAPSRPDTTGPADTSASPDTAAPVGGTLAARTPAATPQAAGTDAKDRGTMTFRAVSPRTQGRTTGQDSATARPGFGAEGAAATRAGAAAASAPAPSAAPQRTTAPAVPPQTPGPDRPAAPAAPPGGGVGGGSSSWTQQVHQLAGGGGRPVASWKPPVDDPFQAAARRRAAARPASLGRRLAARLLDTLLLGAVTAAAGVPLGVRAKDHIDAKIEAARLSGETVRVWLIDGTTSVYLGIVLAVLLLGGVLCEVLPTVKWGRTAGKKLLGLEVRDIEEHEPPGFGAALRRWLVYSVPGLLVVGVVGVLWCLFDKPWRQCWHDKAAHTFVAG